MLFTQHGQDQLAEHVRELGRLLERLDARLARLEDVTRRVDEATREAPDGEAGDLNDGRM